MDKIKPLTPVIWTSRSPAAINFDVAIIEKISQHPCIYETDKFKNNQIINQSWVTIHNELKAMIQFSKLEFDIKQIRRRWTALKELYQRKFKLILKGVPHRPYIHYEKMSFLLPTFKRIFKVENKDLPKPVGFKKVVIKLEHVWKLEEKVKFIKILERFSVLYNPYDVHYNDEEWKTDVCKMIMKLLKTPQSLSTPEKVAAKVKWVLNNVANIMSEPIKHDLSEEASTIYKAGHYLIKYIVRNNIIQGFHKANIVETNSWPENYTEQMFLLAKQHPVIWDESHPYFDSTDEGVDAFQTIKECLETNDINEMEIMRKFYHTIDEIVKRIERGDEEDIITTEVEYLLEYHRVRMKHENNELAIFVDLEELEKCELLLRSPRRERKSLHIETEEANKFFEILKDYPVVWNHTNKHFSDNLIKEEALQEMLQRFDNGLFKTTQELSHRFRHECARLAFFIKKHSEEHLLIEKLFTSTFPNYLIRVVNHRYKLNLSSKFLERLKLRKTENVTTIQKLPSVADVVFEEVVVTEELMDTICGKELPKIEETTKSKKRGFYTRTFLETLEHYPVIWNHQHRNYNNTTIRGAAADHLRIRCTQNFKSKKGLLKQFKQEIDHLRMFIRKHLDAGDDILFTKLFTSRFPIYLVRETNEQYKLGISEEVLKRLETTPKIQSLQPKSTTVVPATPILLEECRICLVGMEHPGKSMSFTHENGSTYEEIYEKCTGRKGAVSNFPKICQPCEKKLLTCYDFLQLCDTNDKKIVESQQLAEAKEAEAKAEEEILAEPLFDSVLENLCHEDFEDWGLDFNLLNNELMMNPTDLILPMSPEVTSTAQEVLLSEITRMLDRSDNVKLDRRVVCYICGVQTTCLDKHLVTHGVASSGLQCAHCPKFFPHKSSLAGHMHLHFPDAAKKSFVCKYCSEEFNNITSKRNHILNKHKKNERYRCSLCQFQTIYAKNLKNHMVRHLGNACEQFSCHECDKVFANKDRLLKHLYTIHKDKTIKCDFCERMFNNRQNLKQHMIVHTGEKNYICPICGREFVANHGMRTHVKKMHPGYVLPPKGTIANVKALARLAVETKNNEKYKIVLTEF